MVMQHEVQCSVFSVQKHINIDNFFFFSSTKSLHPGRTVCILGTKLKLGTSHFNADLAETAALSAMKLPSHIHMYPSSTT